MSMKNRFLYYSTPGSMFTPPIPMCVGYPWGRGVGGLGVVSPFTGERSDNLGGKHKG